MIRHLLSTALFIGLNAFAVQAQVEKTFFQSFDIKDGVRSIYIQSFDNYELKSWNGVQLMIETSARLDGGNMDLLGILIKDNYYGYYLEEGTEGVVFRPKLIARPQIKNRDLICKQTVKMIIYIPEEFIIHSNTELIRKELIYAKGKR